MRLGIDVGGTKIEGIALGDDGAVISRRRVPTPVNEYGRTVQTIVELVRSLEADAASRLHRDPVTASVGIGIPGTISSETGLVKNANSTWLIGQPLQQDLEQRLGRPVRIANDANCFALSEATDGAAEGADVVFGVIIGTGTGAGIVVHGRVIEGRNRIAGEWGHNPMPWPEEDERPGLPCYCGRRGCIETYLSGPGLTRAYAMTTGVQLAAHEIAARGQSGDVQAKAVLERYNNRMARALASVINVLDPDVIVLGGGLSNLPHLYEAVPRLWRQHVFSDRVRTLLLRAKHGDSSGVRGAAWLWP